MIVFCFYWVKHDYSLRCYRSQHAVNFTIRFAVLDNMYSMRNERLDIDRLTYEKHVNSVLVKRSYTNSLKKNAMKIRNLKQKN